MPFTWNRSRSSERVAPTGATGTAIGGTVAPATLAFTPLVGATGAATENAESAARADAGRLLVQLFQYLEHHAVEHPGLMPVIARLGDAVAEYRTGQSADPYTGVRAVVSAIQGVRASDRSLPEP